MKLHYVCLRSCELYPSLPVLNPLVFVFCFLFSCYGFSIHPAHSFPLVIVADFISLQGHWPSALPSQILHPTHSSDPTSISFHNPLIGGTCFSSSNVNGGYYLHNPFVNRSCIMWHHVYQCLKLLFVSFVIYLFIYA